MTSAAKPRNRGERAGSSRGARRLHAGSEGSGRRAPPEGLGCCGGDFGVSEGKAPVRMRRSPRPSSAAAPHKHTPNFYSDNDNNSVSATSGDSSGHRSTGPGPGEPEGRRARGSSCGEPALSAGVPGGTTWAGSSRQKPAPRSHKGQTACGAATVRGGASELAGTSVVSEEQLDLLPTLDLRQEMPPPRVSKSFLNQLFQVLSVLLSLLGDVLVSASREVCSIRFLLTAVSLLSLFLAGKRVLISLGPEGGDSATALGSREPKCSPFSPVSLSALQAPQGPLVPARTPTACPWLDPSSLFPPPRPFMPEKPFSSLPLRPPLSPALWWGLLYLVPPLENEPKEMLTMSEYHERVRSQGQQLQQLQAELDKLHKEMSSVRAANSERVAKLVFQRLNEDFVRKPDYALSSVGASIDLEKTSRDYEDADTAYFWNRFSFWNYARPPTVILEPDVFPGNCWAFEGDQGQVVIRLPGRVQLSDITLQHPPPSVAHTRGANSAPRDFAVYGLQVDDETEVFLGKFTFDVEKSEIQTFHLQNDPPAAFPKVKIQILSNWGHPRFTCLYRVRAHGERTSEGAGDSTTGVTGGLH
ncbi:sperm-associated antigen 4 protein isoform X3 [Loxodonta africana]|uniref:sperm-associated antigen 4 protein isoform X3 n=1 Tax=Loxodonta africana TaxID=9785 RepID=UPI0030CFC1F7